MTRIVINGQRFRTSKDWKVNEVQIGYVTELGGSPNYLQAAFDPSGPDAVLNAGFDVSVNEWTDGSIDLNATAQDNYIAELILLNGDRSEFIVVDVAPDQAAVVIAAAANIDSVTAQPNAKIALNGQGLDTPGTYWRVFTQWGYDNYFYPPGHPLEANNPAGSTVTVQDGTWVEIRWPDYANQVVDYVQTRDENNQVIDEWYGDSGVIGETLTYPTLTNICSPQADTIRFEGYGFVNNSFGPVTHAITRFYENGPNVGGTMTIYEFADGSPDQFDWSLITHTDTVIELHNPRLSANEPYNGDPHFIVTGVAFHAGPGQELYYHEPWGTPYSAPVDGNDNCTPPPPPGPANIAITDNDVSGNGFRLDGDRGSGARVYGVTNSFNWSDFRVSAFDQEGYATAFDGDGVAVANLDGGAGYESALDLLYLSPLEGVVVSGIVSLDNSTNDAAIAWFNPDGTLAASGTFDLGAYFGAGGGSAVARVPSGAHQGKFMQLVFLGNPADIGVVRYNADLTVDTTWGTDGIAIMPNSAVGLDYAFPKLAIQVDPITGDTIALGNDHAGPQIRLARFDTNGDPQSTWGDGTGLVNVYTVGYASGLRGREFVMMPDGGVVGIANAAGIGAEGSALYRLSEIGEQYTAFGFNTEAALGFVNTLGDQGRATAIERAADGSFYVVGYGGRDVAQNQVVWVVKLAPDGTADPTYGDSGTVTGYAGAFGFTAAEAGIPNGGYFGNQFEPDLLLLDDGRVIVSVRDSTSQPDAGDFLVRVLADGSGLDPTFG